MKIIQITSGPADTNGFLIYDEDTKEAALIDVPPGSADFFTRKINEHNLKLNAIWLTHSHWDHTGDVPKIQEKFADVDLYVHKDDEYRCIEPMKGTKFSLPFKISPCYPNKYFAEGDTVTLGSMTFDILHTPGHTEGSVSLVNNAEKTVFVGDVLFKNGIGRTDLFGGDYKLLISTIRTKLYTLPDDYVVQNGHGMKTTIGAEKVHNPFVKA